MHQKILESERQQERLSFGLTFEQKGGGLTDDETNRHSYFNVDE